MRNLRSLLSAPILGLLLVLSISPTCAFGTGLFVAEAAVADEDSGSRNAALSRMLADVMVRVSGNTGIAAQPAARQILDAAPSLVQQYRYRTSEQNGEIERVLWARFEQGGVERMMRERGLPVWSPRPKVLLWLATEQGTQRTLLNLESHAEARDALLARAGYRGMPLQLTLMDLEDQAKLAPADVWSDDKSTIREASARYRYDVIATGRLQAQSGNKWRGSWSIHSRDSVQTFETPAQLLKDALPFAVDQIQNLLAAALAPMPGGNGDGLLVRFSAVGDLPAYARLVDYLQGLSTVSGVALRDASDDLVTVEIRLRGSEDELRRELDAGAQVDAEPGGLAKVPVRPVGDGAAVSPPQADLYYRLRN